MERGFDNCHSRLLLDKDHVMAQEIRRVPGMSYSLK